jgi:hypothetical protein
VDWSAATWVRSAAAAVPGADDRERATSRSRSSVAMRARSRSSSAKSPEASCAGMELGGGVPLKRHLSFVWCGCGPSWARAI